MGLTVHFQLSAPADTTAAAARELVRAAWLTAQRFQREGLVDKVGAVREDKATREQWAIDWLVLPVPDEPNTSTGAEIVALAGGLFCVRVGPDCEPLWLGLCRYPTTVEFHGQELPTKRGTGWRLSGACKTQYASLHGEEHFFRCHRAVVELLAALRPLGFRVRISDEGSYWPRRSVSTLRKKVHFMNRLVAATAGALKDGAGLGAIESPIFEHPQFEQLEAEGVAGHPRVADFAAAVRRACGEQS